MRFLYEFKKIIKSNDKASNILRYFYIPIVVIKKIIFDFQASNRKKGYKNDKYDTLRKYKGIHKGKRCFIVATGPSLTIEDLEKLKDEYTFSMNSIYTSYANTDWRPTYYVIQDPFVYEKIHKDLNSSDYEGMFIGSLVLDKFKVEIDKNINVFPLDLIWQQIPRMHYHTQFSEDIYERVYSGYNVAYSTLQIAAYMGFTEIYLIGADCNYLQEKKYFMADKNRKEERYFTQKFYESNTDKFILAYEVAKEYANNKRIELFNATRGGLLEVYERVNFDEVIKEEV